MNGITATDNIVFYMVYDIKVKDHEILLLKKLLKDENNKALVILLKNTKCSINDFEWAKDIEMITAICLEENIIQELNYAFLYFDFVLTYGKFNAKISTEAFYNISQIVNSHYGSIKNTAIVLDNKVDIITSITLFIQNMISNKNSNYIYHVLKYFRNYKYIKLKENRSLMLEKETNLFCYLLNEQNVGV